MYKYVFPLLEGRLNIDTHYTQTEIVIITQTILLIILPYLNL